MNNVFEDSDCGDYPKSRPLVKSRVIVAALISIAITLFVVSVVVWLTGRV